MPKRWPAGPMRRAIRNRHRRRMWSEVIRDITIRPLRNGEAAAVQAVFDGLGPRSRLQRFDGAKNVLLPSDLERLSRVDANHHAVVAVVGGRPVGVARLVRDGTSAEVAFAVIDEWQGKGVGTVLCDRLAADARAAGITELTGTVRDGNAAALALIRRLRSAVAPVPPHRLAGWRTQSG
jgi:GNAT superfamily N-acetyltransferase